LAKIYVPHYHLWSPPDIKAGLPCHHPASLTR
jgi:hypothetical protein